MPPTLLIPAIVTAITAAGTIIAKAIRWSAALIVKTRQRNIEIQQRGIDALIENARSNAEIRMMITMLRDEFRSATRKIDRPSRTQTQPKLSAIRDQDEGRDVKKRRAITERGAQPKSRARDDEET